MSALRQKQAFAIQKGTSRLAPDAASVLVRASPRSGWSADLKRAPVAKRSRQNR